MKGGLIKHGFDYKLFVSNAEGGWRTRQNPQVLNNGYKSSNTDEAIIGWIRQWESARIYIPGVFL